MGLMGCANEQAGRACMCDDCQGIQWPAPPPISMMQVRRTKRMMKALGKAAARYRDAIFLDVLKKKKKR